MLIGQVGDVNYLIQKTKVSQPRVVHVDQIKQFEGDPPCDSWLKVEQVQETVEDGLLSDNELDLPEAVVECPKDTTVDLAENTEPLTVHSDEDEGESTEIRESSAVSDGLRRSRRKRKIPERLDL